MSIIIGIKDNINKRIVVGCDSQITFGGYNYTDLSPSMHKIFTLPNQPNTIFGAVGDLTFLNMMQSLEINLLDELSIIKNEIDYKYIIRNVVPKLFKLATRNRCIKNDKMTGSVMIAHKNMLFTIKTDGACCEHEYSASIGYTVAGIFSSNKIVVDNDINILTNVINSVDNVIESSTGCGYPIVIKNNKDDKINIVKIKGGSLNE